MEERQKMLDFCRIGAFARDSRQAIAEYEESPTTYRIDGWTHAISCAGREMRIDPACKSSTQVLEQWKNERTTLAGRP